MINISDISRKSLKVDKKSCNDILIYYIGYEASDGVKLLYINFNKIKGLLRMY